MAPGMGLVKEGHIFEDGDEIAALKDENRDLRRQLNDALNDVSQLRRENDRAVASLRKQLSPLYRALQGVFGDMEAFGGDDAPAASSRTSAVWESWKARMPGRTAQVIDALLLHGSMNSTQIGIAIGIHRNNVPPLIHKLKTAGLIDKNGNQYALKQL